jgi:hypothetical protein
MLRSFIVFNGKKLYFQAVATNRGSSIEEIHRQACKQELVSGNALWWALIEFKYDHKADTFTTVVVESERREEPNIIELNVQAKQTPKKKKVLPEEVIQQMLEEMHENIGEND